MTLARARDAGLRYSVGGAPRATIYYFFENDIDDCAEPSHS